MTGKNPLACAAHLEQADVIENEYWDFYRAQLAHQREHGASSLMYNEFQPMASCIECLVEHKDLGSHRVQQRFSWAIPNDAALDTIAKHSPAGVVEIGAGAGYWAKMLRARGVDVISYDPAPPGSESYWHAGQAWSEVLLGDHTAVRDHPDRTLLTVWPNYGQSWAADAADLFAGDTIVYVGEGMGGCTADDRFHTLLGYGKSSCWCPDSGCTCVPQPDALFREVERVAIPQWFGLHDRLTVHERIAP